MTLFPAYDILETLDETRSSTVYRARKSGNGSTVIIKALKTEDPSPSEIARFKQEYAFISQSDLDGIVRPLDILEHRGAFAIILDDCGGVSLERLLDNGPLDLPLFLDMAVKLAGTVGCMHQQNIIHRDIKPRNIIVNPLTMEVMLTDFGIATELTRENDSIYDVDVIQGTLAYMSPEQTGRMNRAVDYRTDLYSLGVTFYRMLTGFLPFSALDPMDMIYSHIARTPVPPSEIDPGIPGTLSRIIERLLLKTPEERYQNGLGLQADLIECRQRLKTTGCIDLFDLGLRDVPAKFFLPQRLFGREKEIEALMSCYERVSNGKTELMLVTGEPGIGKSALVQEIHKPIVETRGYFISGKYDQFRTDVPYSAVIQALQGLLRQLLGEPEDALGLWRNKIIKALGPNPGLITTVIPRLKLIIGDQPEMDWEDTDMTKDTFYQALKNMISMFSSSSHPLTLFLDDLQWADPASLVFLRRILMEPDIRSLLIIASYRDNEVDDIHPVSTMLRKLERNHITPCMIKLGPIAVNAVNALSADFLKVTGNESWPLASLIHEKTEGNPFFVNQFFKTLYEENVISMAPGTGWSWDMNHIKSMDVTDNVVTLLAAKITRLPQRIRQVLVTCACIGNQFDLSTLASILDRPLVDILADVSILIEENLIAFFGDAYRFHHDRIHEAAYSLLSDKEKADTHWHIGRLALENATGEQIKEKILYIVNQLNAGSSRMTGNIDRDRLVALNLQAAKTAKRAGAFESSLAFLEKGIALLGDSPWDTQDDTAHQLFSEAAVACFRLNRNEEMDRYCSEVISHAGDVVDTVRVYDLLITSAANRNNLKESLRISLELLGRLDIHFPESPGQAHLRKAYQQIKPYLTEEGIKALYDLPAMTNKKTMAAMRILTRMTLSVSTIDTRLKILGAIKRFQLTVTHGTCSESIITYAHLGAILCAEFGEIEAGENLARAAVDIAEHRGMPYEKMSADMYYITMVCFWTGRLSDKMDTMLDLSQDLLRIGHVLPAALGITFHAGILYTGKPLPEITKDYALQLTKLKKLGFTFGITIYQLYWQYIKSMMGETEHPSRIKGELFDLESFLPVLEDMGAHIFIALAALLEMHLAFILGDRAHASASADLLEKHMDYAHEIHAYPTMVFLLSLVRLAECDSAGPEARKAILTRVRKNKRLLKTWAAFAPMNLSHKLDLVEAELLRWSGRHARAFDYYDKAVTGAAENGYLQEEALACQLTAGYWLTRGKDQVAGFYMDKAARAYERWGARAVAQRLRSDGPHPASPLIRSGSTLETSMNASAGRSLANLDLSTIVKNSQALSMEIDLDKLLEKVMHLSMENAGAQKGFLILESKADNRFYIEAEKVPDRDICVLAHIPLEGYGNLSSGIVQYVARTREVLLLNNASTEGDFTQDAYVSARKVQSVLCLPVLRQSRRVGVLYLENNSAVGAFSQNHVDVLVLLSSQAAISIENARLYENVRKAREYTRHLLETANEGFWLVDKKGIILDVNTEMCTILGRKREDIIGHYVYEFGDKDSRDRAREQQKLLIENNKASYENTILRPDGTAVYCQVNVTLVYGDENAGAFAMVTDITQRKKAENEVIKLNAELEKRVIERTNELNLTLEAMKKVNSQIMESIRYAKLIQESILPNIKQVKSWLPHSFFIWEPRDIIGGDFFYAESFDQGYIVAVVDCTGHGVPGAFMTMIAATSLRRITHMEHCLDPGEILKRLNMIVKTSLQQDTAHARSNDGLDAAVCFIDPANRSLTYAGANIPLIFTRKGRLTLIRGDRQSIGYPGSNLDFTFSEHHLDLHSDLHMYLATDGMVDQLGGPDRTRFGRKRFHDLVEHNCTTAFDEQRNAILRAFYEHQGDCRRQDDITVVGFRPPV